MFKSLHSRPLFLPFAFFALGAVPITALSPQSTDEEAPQIHIALSDGQAAERPVPPTLEEDESIAIAIETEYMSDPTIPFDAIEVKVEDGVVHLEGEVSAMMKKERAVKIAESVRGVDVILDQIMVRPSEVLTDKVIAENVRTALLFDLATDEYEIVVRSEDGAVTLEGQVDSWAERRLARQVAGNVRGVRSIKNDIRVNLTSERPDTELRHDIIETLRWDELVDHPLVRVKVEDGVVTMSGAVGSVAERRRAEAAAWVAGVQSVNMDDLSIESYAADPDQRGVEVAAKDPKEMKAAMHRAFKQSPRLNGRAITIHLDGHHATLRGVVESTREKQAAGSIALHTTGVWSISNHLRVKPVIVEDATIDKRLQKLIMMDPIVFGTSVDPVVHEGVVRLFGTVDNGFERQRIEDLASGLAGVRHVHNRIQYEGAAHCSYTPFLVPHPLPLSRTPAPWTMDIRPIDDRCMEREIMRRWNWHAQLDDADLEVSVEDGVATLSGRVKTWSQRMTSEQTARQAGARSVRNRITLETAAG